MDSREIKELLHRYVAGELPGSDYAKLKEALDLIDDSELDECLESTWENYNTNECNKRAYQEVLNNVSQEIVAERSTKKYSLPIYKRLLRIAAVILLPLLLTLTLVLYHQNTGYEKLISQEYRVSAEKGERSTLILPDGTKVILNSSSTISYQASFQKENRLVHLSGEAYFEVTRDSEGCPFIVRTDAADIKVLGTSFNVCSNPGDDFFETSLVRGSVEILPAQKNCKKMILKPNQKVRLNKLTNQWVLSNTDLWMETAWRRGDLVFRSQPLSSVIERLESYYGVTIQIEGTYPEGLFTGSFHEADVNPVLVNLQQHYNFTYAKNGNKIKIKFN